MRSLSFFVFVCSGLEYLQSWALLSSRATQKCVVKPTQPIMQSDVRKELCDFRLSNSTRWRDLKIGKTLPATDQNESSSELI